MSLGVRGRKQVEPSWVAEWGHVAFFLLGLRSHLILVALFGTPSGGEPLDLWEYCPCSFSAVPSIIISIFFLTALQTWMIIRELPPLTLPRVSCGPGSKDNPELPQVSRTLP